MRQHEHDLGSGLQESLDETFGSHAESATDERRKLPSEHKDTHRQAPPDRRRRPVKSPTETLGEDEEERETV